MTSILGLSLTALLIAGFIWFLPILLILRSRKTNGAEKLFWISCGYFCLMVRVDPLSFVGAVG